MEELKALIDSLSEDELYSLREAIYKKLYTIPNYHPDAERLDGMVESRKPPVKIVIPYKFPSLNEYVNECRKNPFAGANMKKRVQRDIGYFTNTLPVFTNPVTIEFTWVEGNKRRDLDNIAFAKKFILDSLVECGRLKDDNRRVVTAFRDNFKYGDDWKVILEIREVEK